jgi:hypothetical protein
MGMEDRINIGQNLATAMRDKAKDLFKGWKGAAGCICVAVRTAVKKGENCVYARNGAQGLTDLRDALRGNGLDLNADLDQTRAALIEFLKGAVKFQSSEEGTVVQQKEVWVTHNCAEAHVAVYLNQSKNANFKAYTIASYQKLDEQVVFKALCDNCAQWCQQNFTILDEYKAFLKNG